MNRLFAIGIAGFLGTMSRYFLNFWVNHFFKAGFPYGTLVVNIAGCFAMGFLMGAGVRHFLLPESWRIVIGMGFLGAFTTFSAFSYDTLRLIEHGHWKLAGANVFLNVIVCLLATGFGLSVDRLFIAKG